MSRFSLLSIVAMAVSIKLFQYIRSLYQTMGIYSQQPNQHFSFNSRKMFFLFGLTLFFIIHFGYFLSETTFDAFYRSTPVFNALIDMILNIWRMPTILHLIELCEEFIGRSMYQIKSMKINGMTKKWALFVFFRIATRINFSSLVQSHVR